MKRKKTCHGCHRLRKRLFRRMAELKGKSANNYRRLHGLPPQRMKAKWIVPILARGGMTPPNEMPFLRIGDEGPLGE